MFEKFVRKRGFSKRGPWITKFTLDGIDYGGTFDPYSDARINWFKEHFPNVTTILDMGSLEGAQSFILSQLPHVKQVVGLESREANLAKAEYVRKLLNLGTVSFHKTDLEQADLTKFGRFDVVFCAGLLYHLMNPWDLIRRISLITDQCFIWTHYAKEDCEKAVRNGYRGMLYQELGLADPQSGMSPASFWLEFDELIRMIKDNGFPQVTIIEKNQEPEIGPVTTLIARKS